MKKLFLPFQPNFPLLESTMESYDIYGFLNKVVERVNALQKIIEDFNIDEIEEMLKQFKKELEQEINNQVDLKLEDFEIKITSDVHNYLLNYISYFNTQLEILAEEVNEKIEQIELGEIDVLNPLTGQVQNINIVISDIYDLLRNGISAEEFDDLEMTATYFDSLEITAYDFDFSGKEILMG